MSGRPVTIKLGGVAGQHADSVRVVAEAAPADTVVVHGGGNEVAEWSRRLGLEPKTHDGLRVTDPETLEVALAVLGGLVNTRLVAAFAALGRPRRWPDRRRCGPPPAPASRARARRGGRGRRSADAAPAVGARSRRRPCPVVASLGVDAAGSLLNVNADEAAGAIAAARGGLLLLCTDVPGVQADGRTLEHLDADGVERMLGDGSASAGMRPKLRAALVAAGAGCEVRIVDGRSASALAGALEGTMAGTLVTAT